jgi:hypothetical protein
MRLSILAIAVLALGFTGCDALKSEEAAKAKAEAEKAKAEAEKAKAEAEKAKADAEKAKREAEEKRTNSPSTTTPPGPTTSTYRPAPPSEPAGVTRAKQFLDHHAKDICMFAFQYKHYAYTSHSFDGFTESGDGYYILAYTWKIKGNFATQTMTFEMNFTKDGTFSSLSVKRHSAVYNPFDLNGYYLDELKAQVKQMEGVKDSVRMKQEVDNTSAKGLCEFYLKLMQR